MPLSPASAEFTPERVLQLARTAASTAGLVSDQAELVRMGSHAIVRLAGGVIARVARDHSWSETSEREVQLASVLRDTGVPCVRPWPVRQPIAIDGHPITFWEEIAGGDSAPTIDELGVVLLQLHQVKLDLSLPPLDPWGHTPERIEQAPIDETDRQTLRLVLDDVRNRWASARFTLDEAVIHGDAHLGNLLRDADGAAVLLDLDSACVGRREWDLAPTGLYATSLGWISKGEYQSFVAAYGFDVTTAPAFPVLRLMRELRMTAWLAMHAAESVQMATEVVHRIACLNDPDLPRHWSAR